MKRIIGYVLILTAFAAPIVIAGILTAWWAVLLGVGIAIVLAAMLVGGAWLVKR